MSMAIRGACHCGNISFALEWPQDGPIVARACGCSFCTKHGGVWTSHPRARLEVSIERPDEVERYQFGTRTAVFHVCSGCGVVPVVTSEIEGKTYAVVSVNAFEEVASELIAKSAADFEGEGTDARLARRVRNWIGEVRFVTQC